MRKPLYLLCIDLEAATVTRYARFPGHNRPQRLQRAVLEPRETLRVLGNCVDDLNRFRLFGQVSC
jgi:hypothetical protein